MKLFTVLLARFRRWRHLMRYLIPGHRACDCCDSQGLTVLACDCGEVFWARDPAHRAVWSYQHGLLSAIWERAWAEAKERRNAR